MKGWGGCILRVGDGFIDNLLTDWGAGDTLSNGNFHGGEGDAKGCWGDIAFNNREAMTLRI